MLLKPLTNAAAGATLNKISRKGFQMMKMTFERNYYYGYYSMHNMQG